MAKKPKEIDYRTTAEPKGLAGDIPVFCAYDEIVPIGKMVPNPKNPNEHPKEQIHLLWQIIQAQGWRSPITVSNRSGFIVKGHGRLMAAIHGEGKFVPVDYQNYASEAEEYADLVADNRLSELADLNTSKLADLLVDLDTGEIPILLTGYDEEDLGSILDAFSGEDDSEPDDKDTEQEQPFTAMAQSGDMWQLGHHRLIVGDATDPNIIEKLMDGERADMVHTDPPYGVAFTGSGRDRAAWDMIKNDDLTGDDLLRKLLIPAFNLYAKYTKPEAGFYIWHASVAQREFQDAMTAAGIMVKQYIIWVKNNFVIGHADYHWMHEPCFYAYKDGHSPKFYGDRSNTTVWRVTTKADGQMMTNLGSGLVLTDGHGSKLFVSPTPPKGKKQRYIRMEEEKPVDLYNADKMSTVWEVAKETNALHPTQKPVELPIRAIENSSQPGDLIIDFFGGSGSTLLAAEMTGRKCYTSELDPKYADVIISRYVQHTGNIGCSCIRNGQEIPYMNLVSKWAADNGQEEVISTMKTPIVVLKKMNEQEAGDNNG